MKIPKNMNEQEVLPRVPTTIGDGTKSVTTAGTAVQLSDTTVVCFYVLITAKPANTGNIYIGGENVASTRGIICFPGQTMRIDIDDLSKIYIDSAEDGEGVVYTYVAP